MRSQFGHFGDAVEGLREIFDGTKEKETRRRIVELTRKLVDLYGEDANLLGFWPDFEALERKAGPM